MKDIIKLGKQLGKQIGAHNRVPYLVNGTRNPRYEVLEQQSGEAILLAIYLVTMLDNRHMAVEFSKAAGIVGYINMR
jgi:hypothetical protein